MKSALQVLNELAPGAALTLDSGYVAMASDHPVCAEIAVKAMIKFAEIVRDEQIRLCAAWSVSAQTYEQGSSESISGKHFDHAESVVKVKVR